MIKDNISLKSYNTFGIDVRARHFVSVKTIDELKRVLSNKDYPEKFILSGGSNMLLTKDVDALVIHINLKGIEIVDESDRDVDLKVFAGENWHETVMFCLKKNYGGIENLSLIPGNVGTAPIQNIGAYGVELKDIFVSCEALNIETLELIRFSNEELNFGYRESIFKNEVKGKYIITSLILKLSKAGHHQLHMEYGAIKNELESFGIKEPTIKDISNAVVSIRKSKLPDPDEIGNSGSFFKNPIIQTSHYLTLKKQFNEIPSYRVSDSTVKVPAAWLIEKAGFKGKTFGEYGVHRNQALVLVNYDDAKGKDLLKLAIIIQKTIYRIFAIKIEMEVNII